MRFFNPEHREDTVSLFIDNLLNGTVSIEYDKFGSGGDGLRFAEELAHKLDQWQGEIYCPDEDYHRIVEWLYDAIIKARAFGALKGEFHDSSYERRIKELESQLYNKDKEISVLESKNKELTDTLYQVTAKPPMTKDFKALM